MKQAPLVSLLPDFLSIYEKLVESKEYSWEYAEKIARDMRTVFAGESVPPGDNARTLGLAIRAAYHMNRFAAMDTCRSMITSIRAESLGIHVASVLFENKDTFLSNLEPSECQSEAVRAALRQLRAN
jgi:hypothetical protein